MARAPSLIIKLKLPLDAQNPRKRKLPHQSQAQTDKDIQSRALAPAPHKQSSQAPIFTQGQLALALSLQKSKPLELPTTDYIQQLRKRIKLGRGEEQHRYVDSAEFWKDQYEKILEEKRAWEGKARSLMEERDRGRGDGVVVEEGWELDGRELEFRPFACIALLRQTQSLGKLLTDANIDAPTMLKSIQTTLLQMSSLISQVCQENPELTPEESRRNPKREHIEGAIHTVGVSYHQCIRGFNHLCRDIPGRQVKNVAVHSFSKLFFEILGHVHKVCEASVQYRKRLDRSKAAAQGEGSGENSTGFSSSRYDVVNMNLSKLLVIMITSPELNENLPGHIDILEGYLFHLLQDTGSTLSEIIFLSQVSATTNPGHKYASHKNKTEPDPIAQTKSRYLIFILKQIIKNNSKVSQMLNEIPRKAVFTRSKTMAAGTGKRGLCDEAKRKLQHTLLKSVFGSDDFDSSLKAPESPEYEMGDFGVEGTEAVQFSDEWFVESLWELVGWDVLKGN